MSLATQEFCKDPHSSHKNWIFTINNYTEEDWNFVSALECSRKAIGKEVGKNGTPHLQGFVVFKKAYRFTGMKKLFPTAHLQVAKSTQHAWNYCIKDGNFIIENNTNPGKRTDIEAFRDAIKSGASDREMLEQFPAETLKYHKQLDFVRSAYSEKRTTFTKCIWVWGPPDTFKSDKLKTQYPDAVFLRYNKPYFTRIPVKHDIVILDDIDIEDISRSLFLQLVNHTPYDLRVLYGTQNWNPKIMIIVSNFHPSEWSLWKYPAVQKRIREIVEYEFDPDYVPSWERE